MKWTLIGSQMVQLARPSRRAVVRQVGLQRSRRYVENQAEYGSDLVRSMADHDEYGLELFHIVERDGDLLIDFHETWRGPRSRTVPTPRMSRKICSCSFPSWRR